MTVFGSLVRGSADCNSQTLFRPLCMYAMYDRDARRVHGIGFLALFLWVLLVSSALAIRSGTRPSASSP